MLRQFLLLVLLALLPMIAAAQSQKAIDYVLDWDGVSSSVKVQMSYDSANRKSSKFSFGLPQFGGQTDIFSVIQNIRSDPSDELQINASSREITIHHHGKSKRTLTYEINGQLQPAAKNPISSELFRPVVSDGFLYLVDNHFMLSPLNHTVEHMRIRWRSFPTPIAYFNSLAPTSTPKQTTILSPAEMGKLIFVAGRDLELKQHLVHGIPYYAMTPSHDELEIKTQIKPFFTDFFPAIRNFWQDYQGKYQYAIVLPVLSQAIGRDLSGSGGFAWGDGFVMKYSRQFGQSEKRVLAHETSHYWIGKKLKMAGDDFANQWFSEGFNDYVTLINLAQSKVFSDADFLAYINNEVFEKHYRSSVRDTPDQQIKEKFWTNADFQKLPYRRGLIYAFYLDNQIRLNSAGQHSLRDLLLDLYQKQPLRQPAPAGLTIAEFIAAGAKYLPREKMQYDVQHFMLDGQPIDWGEVSLIPSFQITFKNAIPTLHLSNEAKLADVYQWSGHGSD